MVTVRGAHRSRASRAVLQVTSPSDKAFVVGVFEGCVRFRKFLLMIVDAYYSSGEGTVCLKKDHGLYCGVSAPQPCSR